MNSFNISWEERAFAFDSAGVFGEFVWPPRSYSCSFCKRDFRSAQALGGHMNVHRRDRARLNQSLTSPQQREPLLDEPQQFSFQERRKESPHRRRPQSFSESEEITFLSISEYSRIGSTKNTEKGESLSFDHDDRVDEIDLCGGLNLIKQRNGSMSSDSDDDDIDLELRLGRFTGGEVAADVTR